MPENSEMEMDMSFEDLHDIIMFSMLGISRFVVARPDIAGPANEAIIAVDSFSRLAQNDLGPDLVFTISASRKDCDAGQSS